MASSLRGFVLLGAVALLPFAIHCADPPAPPPTVQPTHTATATTPTATTTIKPQGTGTKKTPTPTERDSGITAPAPKSTQKSDAGAGSHTQSSGPGPTCQSLSGCCSKLTNSLEQVGCLLSAGKQNELVCAGAIVTFKCSSIGTQPPAHGPSCAGLTDGALYCGDDGPGGDPSTLYKCNKGAIAIQSKCANGCKTNPGVDDACAATGTTKPPPVGPNCNGLDGSYCGTDFVGGDADTLYTCGDAVAPTSTQACANGCVTTTDGTNDFCDPDPIPPPADGDCTGFPDFSYCGGDGITGDPDTLYTCKGGALTNTENCANGCTVGASNVSDFCSFTAGGTTESCTGLTDGTYCGSNGPDGDPSFLYTCTGGAIETAEFCDLGCFAGDFGGADSCN
jgi:hypothetical protein